MVPYQAAILIAAFTLSATAQETRVLTYRSTVDDTDQPFAVFLPKSYDPARRYPLLLSLHGAGGDHRSGLRQILGPPEQLRDLPLILVAPLGRGSLGYTGIAERDVLDVLATVEKTFPVDPERYYLTGVSMGGSGAYHLLAKYPGLWAAAIVVCGMPTPAIKANPALNSVPLWLLHGESDDVVPVAESRALSTQLRPSNPNLKYTEFPHSGHNIASQAYAGTAWPTWLTQFKRTPSPLPTFRPDPGLKAILAQHATYVYGPGYADIAREAANWSGLRGRPVFHSPVSAHDEPLPLGPLFLFGVQDSNRVPALPLQLLPEAAATHGLLYLTAANGRPVAVFSGRPWWAGHSIALDRGFRWQWLSLPYRLLDPLPDWVLYEGNLDHILAQGSFTASGRLSTADQQLLFRLGKVSILP